MKRNRQFGVVVTTALMITFVGVNVSAKDKKDMFITEGGYNKVVEMPKESSRDSKKSSRDLQQTSEKIDEEFTEEVVVMFATENSATEPTEFASADDIVLNLYIEQKEEEARLARIQEMYERTAWLKNYGINPQDLNEARLNFLGNAHKYLGTPYVWGGTSPRGFDCSGYTQYVMRETFGVDISRTTSSQPGSRYLQKISMSEAQPGDLIYKPGQHTGIYLAGKGGGNLTILHSPVPGQSVKIGSYTRNVSVYRPVAFN